MYWKLLNLKQQAPTKSEVSETNNADNPQAEVVKVSSKLEALLKDDKAYTDCEGHRDTPKRKF